MPNFVVSEGEEFVVEYVSRINGAARTSILKVDTAGVVTLGGKVAAGLNTLASTLAKVGVAAVAGSSGLAADAAHVHQLDSAVFQSAVVTGLNGAGAITLTGAKVGDKVVIATNLTDATNDAANFEATITVLNQLQQSSASDLSTKKFQILLVHLS